MDEQVVDQRSRRVVESRPYHHEGMSVGTRAWLSLLMIGTVAVGVFIWVVGPVLKTHIGGVFGFLSGLSWLWTVLLVVVAIGAALGLLRRFGVIQVVEDLVDLGLRIHRHIIQRRYLLPDKNQRYPVPLDENGIPIGVPGNEPLQSAGALPMPMTSSAVRRAKQQTTVNEVQQQLPQQVIGSSPQALQLTDGSSQQKAPETVISIWDDDQIQAAGAVTQSFQPYVRQIVPAAYDFIEELKMFFPDRDHVFLGRGAAGPLILPSNDLWHVIMAGPTGGGKSVIRRMIMAQLQALGALCYLSDIHYFPFDEETGLDWQPIEERLASPLMRDGYETYQFVEWLARKELQERIDRKYMQQPIGPPLFLFVEELPAIVDEHKEIIPLLTKILREGRKYRICFCGAAQDVLVQTIGASSGVRENIRTGFYTGGDTTSAKVILDLQKGETVSDEGLGQGLVYVKTVKHRATRARIPWPSNESVEALLADSPLPVRKIERVVTARDDQSQTNVRDFPITKVGRAQKPIDPEHIVYAREHPLSDANLSQALGITQYQANKINNLVREEQEKGANG